MVSNSKQETNNQKESVISSTFPFYLTFDRLMYYRIRKTNKWGKKKKHRNKDLVLTKISVHKKKEEKKKRKTKKNRNK